MKKAVKILVQGSVQGVFFRNFIKENADKLDVHGFIRNLENGDVEICAEGNLDNVDKLQELCKIGPKFAKIKEIKSKEIPFQDFKDFKVLHI